MWTPSSRLPLSKALTERVSSTSSQPLGSMLNTRWVFLRSLRSRSSWELTFQGFSGVLTGISHICISRDPRFSNSRTRSFHKNSLTFSMWLHRNPIHYSSCACAKSLSRVRLFATPWTVAHQAPLPMGFSRQEYWSRLPFPSPGDLPDPRIEPESLTSPALAGGFFTTSATWEAPHYSLPSTYVCFFWATIIRCLTRVRNRVRLWEVGTQ